MSYIVAVVDDSSVILENVRMLLAREEMSVVCMNSGERLLKYIVQNTPDIILLDILMPDMDGFDTYIALRKYEDHTGRRHVPVIFMSGSENSDTEEMSFVMGASDYISKPFNQDVLIRRIYRTISNNKTIENLTIEATVDHLTGFLNKTSGTEKVTKLCRRKTGALVIFDLDSFKLVNDLFGHKKGDMILKAFSDVVRKNTRETDTICRIGGDEFMAFFEDLTDTSVFYSMSKRLNHQLTLEAKRLLDKDFDIPLGISMGVVMVPEQGREYEKLFAMADGELYRVKQNGKHGYSIYAEDTTEAGDEDSFYKLDRLEKILEERNEKNGALVLGKDSFTVAYRFIMRLYRRYGGSAALLLFDLSPVDEAEGDYMIEVVQQFGQILEKILRMSDMVMQSSSHGYFALLTECTEPEVLSAIKRIMDAYKELEHSRKVKVDYVFKYTDNTEKHRKK